MTDSRQDALDKVTVEIGGERFWMGNLAEPTLSELLEVQVGDPHEFYANTLRIVHHSLRFANDGIENDVASVERLAALVCRLAPAECIAVVYKIVEFSGRVNAELEGMTPQ